jgi:hypothetical protein
MLLLSADDSGPIIREAAAGRGRRSQMQRGIAFPGMGPRAYTAFLINCLALIGQASSTAVGLLVSLEPEYCARLTHDVLSMDAFATLGVLRAILDEIQESEERTRPAHSLLSSQ